MTDFVKIFSIYWLQEIIQKVTLGDLYPKDQGQNWRSNTEYCNKSWTAWQISSKLSPYIDYKQMIKKVKLGDPHLKDQGQNWRSNPEYYNIAILAYYEGKLMISKLNLMNLTLRSNVKN